MHKSLANRCVKGYRTTYATDNADQFGGRGYQTKSKVRGIDNLTIIDASVFEISSAVFGIHVK